MQTILHLKNADIKSWCNKSWLLFYIQIPVLNKSWLLSRVVVYFCVRTHFHLPCVCVRAFVSQKKKKFPVLNLKWDLCKPLHINWFFSHASKNQKTYIYKIVKYIVIRLYSSDSCKIVKIHIKDGWRFLKKEKKKKKVLFCNLIGNLVRLLFPWSKKRGWWWCRNGVLKGLFEICVF